MLANTNDQWLNFDRKTTPHELYITPFFLTLRYLVIGTAKTVLYGYEFPKGSSQSGATPLSEWKSTDNRIWTATSAARDEEGGGREHMQKIIDVHTRQCLSTKSSTLRLWLQTAKLFKFVITFERRACVTKVCAKYDKLSCSSKVHRKATGVCLLWSYVSNSFAPIALR